MRELSELYTLLYNYYLKVNIYNELGLCFAIIGLWSDNIIDYQERLRLENHLESQRPRFYRNRKFYWDKSYRSVSAYWWPKGQKEQRILFVKRMIEKTSKI